MTQEDKNKAPKKRITDQERFKFIGFEVFPGKPKDLFKSDKEKTGLVDAILKRRGEGKRLRDQCTLMEQRVTIGDRIVMAVACVAILVVLFMPWFSAYNEIIEEQTIIPAEAVADSAAFAVTEGDSLAVPDSLSDSVVSEELAAVVDVAPADEPADSALAAIDAGGNPNEEVIHGLQARKKVHREFDRMSGFGSLISIGSIGSQMFSSGFVLMLTAVIFLAFILLSIALPLYNLYGLFGLKGDSDIQALQLKKIIKLNWIPVILFAAALFISFIGADYGFDPAQLYSSFGSAYGPGVFLDSLSWGVLVSFCCFMLVAVKGGEI
jgi:hypothetical protein